MAGRVANKLQRLLSGLVFIRIQPEVSAGGGGAPPVWGRAALGGR